MTLTLRTGIIPFIRPSTAPFAFANGNFPVHSSIHCHFHLCERELSRSFVHPLPLSSLRTGIFPFIRPSTAPFAFANGNFPVHSFVHCSFRLCERELSRSFVHPLPLSPLRTGIFPFIRLSTAPFAFANGNFPVHSSIHCRFRLCEREFSRSFVRPLPLSPLRTGKFPFIRSSTAAFAFTNGNFPVHSSIHCHFRLCEREFSRSFVHPPPIAAHEATLLPSTRYEFSKSS